MRRLAAHFTLAVIIPMMGSARDGLAQAAARPLSPEERQTVGSGGQVLVTQDVEGLIPHLLPERTPRLRRPSLLGTLFGKKVADGTT